MSNSNDASLPPTPSLPGSVSPRERPSAGNPPINQASVAQVVRDERQAPDPLAIDTSSPELKDGANRCPNCGATDIRPTLGSDELICHYCRHQWVAVRVEDAFGLGDGIDQLEGTVIASGAADIAPDASSMVSFKCSGCGAEVTINTENAMTARCHWCRHVFGVNEQVANGAVPDAVLPFHIRKEDAVQRISQFVGKRRLFALKAFKEQFTPENVTGVYLPYMIVDGNASAEINGYGEIAKGRKTVRTGLRTRTLHVADVYRLKRHADFTVDDLPLESSAERGDLDTSRNTNNIINAIQPFDTKNAVKWNASWLYGFSSEKRDQNVAQLRQRLEDQLLSIARAQVETSVDGYDRGVRWESERLDLHGSRWVTMYLPVWLYSFHQPGAGGGMLHYIAVNGRTGETMGSVPLQRWKILLPAITVGGVIELVALWIVSWLP